MSADSSEGTSRGGPISGLQEQALNCSLEELAAIARDVLDSGSRLRFRARGFSMIPLIGDGDILVVEPVREGGPAAGEIVMTVDDSGMVKVHRLQGRTVQDGQVELITRGDNSGAPDVPVPAAGVLGVVRSIEKPGRTIDLAGEAGVRIAGRLLALLQSASWRLVVSRSRGGSRAGAVAKGLLLKCLGLLARVPRRYLRKWLAEA